MDNGNAPRLMGMGVVFGRCAVGRPTGMADADCSGKRIALEHGLKIGELAFGAAAFDPTIDQRRDAGAVVTAIFEAL